MQYSISVQKGVLRDSQYALFIFLAFIHAIILFCFISPFLFAVAIWWNSNTIAHYFIHTPYFTHKRSNEIFSLFQSLLLGIPQSLWKKRHITHHAGGVYKITFEDFKNHESAAILFLWIGFAIVSPVFFFTLYLPGYFMGLGLCYVQGTFEHDRKKTISHYGILYNWIFFNDGYHVEHHRYPTLNWKDLPSKRFSDSTQSEFPAILRWLEFFSLVGLEKFAMHFGLLKNWLVKVHKNAFLKLWPEEIPSTAKIGIVGGGLFPRTALAIKEICPEAKITVIEASRDHIDLAKSILGDSVHYQESWFSFEDQNQPYFDLLIIPLAFKGDQKKWKQLNCRYLFVHQWFWKNNINSTLISSFLFKRLSRFKLWA